MGFELGFMQMSNNAFFNFKSKVIVMCLGNKSLRSELKGKNISFWYDPDKINSFFEQNDLKEKYDAIKKSKVFNDYMAFCVFSDRLNKYKSGKNLNVNIDNINENQMLNNGFELLDFFMNEPSFKYVLKSDYLSGLLFSNKIPDEADIKKFIDALIKYKKKNKIHLKKREMEEDIIKDIINKLNEFYNFVLENVTPEKRQELEDRNQIICGMLNKSLGKAEYKDEISKWLIERTLKISQLSAAAAVISLFTSLSMAATLAIAAPWLISSTIIILYCVFDGNKSKEKRELLEYLVSTMKENIESQDSKKLKKTKRPRLINSHGGNSYLIN